MKRLVVLASGRGSNFEALVDGCENQKIVNATIIGLITNSPKAGAIEIANRRGIPNYVIDSNAYKTPTEFNRQAYEGELAKRLEELNPDYICLAGYMLIVGKALLKRWKNRILNIHPSLLPAFKGLYPQKQALESGVKWTGCTVHFVAAELDAGPIIAQSILKVEDSDTVESLSARLLPLEHQTYQRALNQICNPT